MTKERLKRLEAISHGIMDAYNNYVDDPEKFGVMIYQAYLDSLCNAWWISDFCHSAAYSILYKTRSKMLDKVCWRANRGEVYFAQELILRKIEFVREFKWAQERNCKLVDFGIIGTNILVEIDGSVHDMKGVVKKDRLKEKAMKLAGYQVLRLKTNYLVDHMKEAMETLVNTMNQPSSKLPPLVLGRFGTSK